MFAPRGWTVRNVAHDQALPTDRCANCARTDDGKLSVGPMTVPLRLQVYLFVAGFEQTVHVRAGFCTDCAYTATQQRATFGERFVLFLVLYLVSWFAIMIAAAAFVGGPNVDIGTASWIAFGLAVVGPMLWVRRPAPLPMVCRYQPIRFLRGVHDVNGTGQPGLRLAFANRDYAAHIPAVVPGARVVC